MLQRKHCVKRGANVIITGRRKEAVEKAAQDLNVSSLVSDQSVLSDIETLAANVAQQFGKVDILLINAGITKFAPIELITENVFNEVMDVNFKGAYFTLSKFIPVLNDGASVYAASKAALNAVMKIAALELASRKIRVNSVSPGPVSTEIMNKLGMDKNIEEQMIGSIPLARVGKASEVADLITFLSGENASFITGSNFLIDGGQSV
ncbi:SDR family oxidoreductase [Cytophagaceae bacterium DM2B3-1]|uniref:SDR family oxidoreductase n=1 Tax=Xanthocytophaga flava TaxID=3048013 RepID=A0ABT7CDI5_9BACT|nr:SDR family oxidoreductase [Xanthocytophaga flavus]MDJ1491790.1 SDR family oxidoreductase [Xanthocytophaga flavus]